ncbi:SDR family oxidoreductase [Chryseolinea sp. H1M3-3]|uniref:SDR family NAD(P)-dependent oxidoreductase n=1 Tax=Chryseolinea sp. H1M3-3 TaxID=3034144 RepID=UPI0023EE0A87|nr:SDR family oxidoreductase [Chryseolinea sp. H1M3-3]
MASENKNTTLQNVMKWAAIGAGTFMIANTIYKTLNRYDLKGKVVLVTGGSRGLGLVLARQLAAKGARLAICARTPEQLGQAHIELEGLGAEVISMTVDVTDQRQVQAMIIDVLEHYGRLDVLINNAGLIQIGPQETMGVNEYEQAMKANFWSALYTMLSVIPYFKEQGGGRIVNITSIGGKVAVPHLLPYTASKFALVGLSEGMHAELKKDNILVTTVVPNLMRTGSPGNALVKGDHEAEYAWFKLSDSSPLLSQSAEAAAKQIIDALEQGQSEAILSATAKAATILQGFAPGWMNVLMSLVNKLLPEVIGAGNEIKKGFESESRLSLGTLGAATDEAAVKNNEL